VARTGVAEADPGPAEVMEQAAIPKAINTIPAPPRSLLTLALLGSRTPPDILAFTDVQR